MLRLARLGRPRAKARLCAALHTFKSPFPDVDIPNKSIPEYVLQISEGPSSVYGEDVALKLSSDRQLTYNQLKQDVFSFGAALHKEFGLKKNDVIGILAPNCPEYGTAVHGSTALGVIVSPFNPAYTETEIKHQLKDSGAKLMITYGGEYLRKAQKANAELGSPVKEFIVIGGGKEDQGDGLYGFSDIVKSTDISAFPKVKIDPSNDVAILPYSSGTTGLPKGVVLTHRNIVANVAQIRIPELYKSGKHSLIGVLPMFHIYGQVVLLNVGLAVGARLNLMEKFEPVDFLRIMQDEKVNIAHLVPPIVLFLAKHPMVDEYDLSKLEEIFSGAAPLGKDLSELVKQRLPNLKIVRQGYGMTELSPAATVDPLGNVALGSAGCVVPNTEMRILDLETGQPVGPNVEGEVCFRGPQVMREYLNNAQATKETIDADGFLHTGDVGYVADDGHLYIEDRVKELIKVKGFQVAPAELEAHLLGHEQVADACVVQKNCDRAGELPKAYVVPKDAAAADKEKIRADVNAHLAEHKHIVEVEFIDAIPKSASGKILRRILRDRENPKRKTADAGSAKPA